MCKLLIGRQPSPRASQQPNADIWVIAVSTTTETVNVTYNQHRNSIVGTLTTYEFQ